MRRCFAVLPLCLLVGLSGCFSTGPRLHTEERRGDPDGDGTKEVLARVTKRGDARVLSESRNEKTGRAGRIYDVGGKPRVIESDEDGDGFFETLQVYGNNLQDFDVYIRTPDGKCTPVSDADLKRLHEANEAIAAAMDSAIHEAVRRTLKKIEDQESSNKGQKATRETRAP